MDCEDHVWGIWTSYPQTAATVVQQKGFSQGTDTAIQTIEIST